MRTGKHIEMLKIVAKGLGELKEQVVFLGGATVGLHLTDPGAPDVRPTDDVDCIVELASQKKYYEMEEKLRGLGFKQPLGKKAPICRWEYAGLLVDVMPTDEKILGFTNSWYQEGIAHAEPFQLPAGPRIQAFTVPYLLASKIEAFGSRGKDDFLASPDMEDIIALIDGCLELKEKVLSAPEKVRSYIKVQVRKFLKTEKFIESIDGHIRSAEPGTSGGRAERVLAVLKEIARD